MIEYVRFDKINDTVRNILGWKEDYNIILTIKLIENEGIISGAIRTISVKEITSSNIFIDIKRLILSELNTIIDNIGIDVRNIYALDSVEFEIARFLEGSNQIEVIKRGVLGKSLFVKMECLLGELVRRKNFAVLFEVEIKGGKPFVASVEDPKNWIILPRNDKVGNSSYPSLLVSIKREYSDKTWEECQKLLHENNEFMLTIRQFVDFLNLLKSEEVFYADGEIVSKSVAVKILNEIMKVKSPWRAEWLDAKFVDRKGKLCIDYHKINDNGDIIEIIEPLQDCLMDNKLPGISLDSWLEEATDQGLPLKNIGNGNLYYWKPIITAVSRFLANSDRVSMNCNRDSGSDSKQGVRRAKIMK